MKNDISQAIPRIDGWEKASGKVLYIADIPYEGAHYARFLRSSVTRGRIKAIHLPPLPEGYTVTDKSDIPGENRIALIQKDWPVFAEDEVRFAGQAILLLSGPDSRIVEDLLSRITVEYEELEGCITLDESLALKGGAIHNSDNLYADYHLEKGNPDKAFKEAFKIIEGIYETGFQEQLYMEPQGMVVSRKGNKIVLHGSLQCPYYVKQAVSEVMGDGIDVQVIQATTGGAFGGKEDYPEIYGPALAAAVWKTGKPIRMIFDRREDLAYTSKRHPSRTLIRTAHDRDGRILAYDFDVLLNGGAYESYSCIVLQRDIFTSTGVYNFPCTRIRGRALATNTVPSGAFRGFGAPQAIFALETHLEKAARDLGLEPLALKKQYFLKQGDPTVTEGSIHEKVIMDQLVSRIEELSSYSTKRELYKSHPTKGIGISLFNHGCGFTGDGEQRIIKAHVSVSKTAEGKVEILMANVEMGQGPTTTFRKIVAHVLDMKPEEIILRNPDTDRVPNSGPTVASRTMMIVGGLVKKAAEQLKAEWKEGEAQLITTHYTMPEGMKWDQNTMKGDAYPSFGWGVNVVEVDVDPLTFEPVVLGAWGVYDVGKAIDTRVVEGQIQGGMSQALGYASLEKLEVDSRGRFRQATMADYIIPTSMDFPRTGADTIDNPYENGPFGAKGMGEMVHDGGHAAYVAAVSQAVNHQFCQIPLSPEVIMEGCEKRDIIEKREVSGSC